MPTSQPVGDVAGVAQCAAASAQVVRVPAVEAAVVYPGARVVLGDVRELGLGDALHETVAG